MRESSTAEVPREGLEREPQLAAETVAKRSLFGLARSFPPLSLSPSTPACLRVCVCVTTGSYHTSPFFPLQLVARPSSVRSFARPHAPPAAYIPLVSRSLTRSLSLSFSNASRNNIQDAHNDVCSPRCGPRRTDRVRLVVLARSPAQRSPSRRPTRPSQARRPRQCLQSPHDSQSEARVGQADDLVSVDRDLVGRGRLDRVVRREHQVSFHCARSRSNQPTTNALLTPPEHLRAVTTP